ncbi:MAG TPA: ABC transporter permease [Actinomycetota bacterium]|nr:ABC transporter permease [Actinomycetota bacterium]
MRLWSVGFLLSTVNLSMPLVFAAFGGLFSERSGVINIALEGMMLFGAFVGVAVDFWTGSPWLGLLAGVAVGGVLGALHGLFSITVRADQIVSATAINLLALGLTSALIAPIWGAPGVSPSVELIPPVHIPGADHLGAVGRFLQGLTPLDYAGFALVVVTFYVLYRRPSGLRLRACGESPDAAASSGVNVIRTRYVAVIVSGCLAALGGVYLSLGEVGLFQRGMTQGRGFIALAAMIFGKWRPIPVFLACVMLGAADAFQFRAQALGVPIPNELLLALPYIVALIALATFVGRASAPAAIGRPYVKG